MMRAGTDVAFSALCPACMHKALALDSRFSIDLKMPLEVYRQGFIVCEACEEAEKARRFQKDAQGVVR